MRKIYSYVITVVALCLAGYIFFVRGAPQDRLSSPAASPAPTASFSVAPTRAPLATHAVSRSAPAATATRAPLATHAVSRSAPSASPTRSPSRQLDDYLASILRAPTATPRPAARPTVRPTQKPTAQKYVLNTNTGVFHRPNCSSVRQMKESNKKIVTKTRAEIISFGYSPCGRCKP